MAEIGKLPPAWRIEPSRPGAGPGGGKRAPHRKPGTAEQEQERRQRRQERDDKDPHIDEYA